MLLDIHYSSMEIFPGHLSSTMQTLSEFSLAGFWTSCRAVTADHSLSEFSMPLTVGCISCCSSVTVLKWSRALLGTQSISAEGNVALEPNLRILYLTSPTPLHLHWVLECLLYVKSFVSLFWGKSWICEYLSYGGNLILKMSFHGISSSALSSLLHWSMWAHFPHKTATSWQERWWDSGTTFCGNMCAVCAAVFWHRKNAYQSLLSALHDWF